MRKLLVLAEFYPFRVYEDELHGGGAVIQGSIYQAVYDYAFTAPRGSCYE